MKQGLRFIVLFWLVATSVQAKMTEFDLQNGLHVVVKEDHRSPVVVHQVWYRTGANFEVNGTTGIAHMLEHMMFKGTWHLKPGEFSKRVSQMGGRENAFTSRDYTAYFQIVGKPYLKSVMQLEADRMQNLVFNEKEFQKERQVITEERRWRVEDKPTAKLYERFMATAFMNSPLHHPTIGWMTDIQHYTLADVRDWYHKWYAPNNATLVVVGDVTADEVKKFAEEAYGEIPSKPIPSIKPQYEIAQLGVRRLMMKGPVEVPSLIMGFHVPSLPSAKTAKEKQEVYALSVLASILDGDDSARLTKQLIRKQKIALSAGAGFDETSRWKSAFFFEGSPAKGQSVQALEQAFWAQIKQLQTQPVSRAELQRVLSQAEAQYVYQQDSAMGQAMLIGSLISVGLPADLMDHWVENLRKVTPAQIQAVAQKYFSPDKVTVGILLPNGEKAVQKSTEIPMSGGLR
ncbi:M16 family metallopeptidase [Galenea microaerophila]